MPYTTKQRRAVLQCLEDRASDALTPGDVAEELRRAGSPVGLATVYRQLEQLESAGLLHRIQTGEGALYQYCPHPSAPHGCFLLRCERCGRVSHLDCGHLQTLCDHLAAEHRFRVDLRQTVLTGCCQDCAGKEALHGAN